MLPFHRAPEEGGPNDEGSSEFDDKRRLGYFVTEKRHGEKPGRPAAEGAEQEQGGLRRPLPAASGEPFVQAELQKRPDVGDGQPNEQKLVEKGK